jgi:putative ABC transport system ATP-binding protein
MTLFSELNRRGITVIIVTHEADIAAFTPRRIVFRDGVVVTDELIGTKTTTHPAKL